MQSFVLISMFLICFSTPLTQIGLCMSINTLISRSTFIYKSRVYVKSRSNGICGFFCTWCVRWIGKLFFVIFVFIIMYYFLNSLILLIYKHWQDIFYKYFFDVIMFNHHVCLLIVLNKMDFEIVNIVYFIVFKLYTLTLISKYLLNIFIILSKR